METTVNQLADTMDNVFNGDPWYGDSILKQLSEVSFDVANKRPAVINKSIAEILQHMINWRILAIEKMDGDALYEIEMNSTNDWNAVELENQQDWDLLVQKLEDTQDRIIEMIKSKDQDFLEQRVPGRNYSFNFLIEGIIQHDIYHLGQIGLMKRMLH